MSRQSLQLGRIQIPDLPQQPKVVKVTRLGVVKAETELGIRFAPCSGPLLDSLHLEFKQRGLQRRLPMPFVVRKELSRLRGVWFRNSARNT